MAYNQSPFPMHQGTSSHSSALKSTSPLKQKPGGIQPNVGETYKQYLKRAFNATSDPYGGDVSGMRWDGQYEGPNTRRYLKKSKRVTTKPSKVKVTTGFGSEADQKITELVNKKTTPRKKKVSKTKKVLKVIKKGGKILKNVARVGGRFAGPIGIVLSAIEAGSWVKKNPKKVKKALDYIKSTNPGKETQKALKEKAKSGNVNIGRKL